VRTDRLDPIPGNPPSPLRHPSGCVFHTRCKYTDRVPGERCFNDRPELLESEPTHSVRCHIPSEERRQIAESVLSMGKAPIATAGGGAPLAGAGTVVESVGGAPA
jgi:hypothetical protein